ncbi:MAG: ImmA/IrrE family metallo-endopeptidase [Eubacteriales bacterium]|nr:ImmA/IrrE family metallo-endopeptidase [Eubacteriales bacterium]
MRMFREREIKKEAEEFRKKCKQGKYGILDLFEECERSGYKLIRYPLESDTELGFATQRDNDIIIFTNSSIRLSREIFTLAHEIGHVLLHFGHCNSFFDNNQTISVTHSAIQEDSKEEEANYFAACLLMPKSEVDNFFDIEIDNEKQISALDIARIMSEFKVSFEMALNRLENLGKITKEEKIRLDNEKNEFRVKRLLGIVEGDIKLNEASHKIRVPVEYINYVIYNYNQNAIPLETLERALNYLRLSVEDIQDRLVDKSDLGLEEESLDDLIGGLDN